MRFHNGKVGVWGISYPGFYAAMAAIDAHPALVAASPQAPIADWFVGDDFHHNGAFFLPHAFNFYTAFGKPRPEPTTKWPPRFDHGTADGYEFFLRAGPMPNLDRKYLKGDVAFWKEVMAHESYDAFWQARNTRPHLKAHQARRAHRGRLVRRRGPLRRARDLPVDRVAEPRDREPPGHGPLAARRLVAGHGRRARAR